MSFSRPCALMLKPCPVQLNKKYNDFVSWTAMNICFHSVTSLVFKNILQMFTQFQIFILSINTPYMSLNELLTNGCLWIILNNCFLNRSQSSLHKYKTMFSFSLYLFSCVVCLVGCVVFFSQQKNSTEHLNSEILIRESLFNSILTTLATCTYNSLDYIIRMEEHINF